MKDKILVFVIGLLLGAVITAAGFLVYEKVNKNNIQMPNGEQMQMIRRQDGEEPPQKPDGMQDDSSRPEPPTKNGSSTENNQKNT